MLLKLSYIVLTIIAVIISLFISTIYITGIYGLNTNPFPKEFTMYPNALVPGFLMPSAVFIHVLSLVKLRHEKE